MRVNGDGSLDITIEEVIRFNSIGFVVVINDGKVVAIVDDNT